MLQCQFTNSQILHGNLYTAWTCSKLIAIRIWILFLSDNSDLFHILGIIINEVKDGGGFHCY